MTTMRPLKLVGLDEEDLSVISAHVQDAVVKVGDIRLMRGAQRVLVPMNRFAWERAATRRGRANERRRAVLQFDRVERAGVHGINRQDKEQTLALLALVFQPGDPPGGTISVVCSGDAVLQLEVECIEARLTDLGAAWGASMRPSHAVGRGR